MAFEDLIKNEPVQASPKSKIGLVNLSSNLALASHDHILKREELLQAIMICQGENDYLFLQIRSGRVELVNILLSKKKDLIEKNIMFSGLNGMADPGNLSAINRQSDELTRYRMELEAIKSALKNQGQYIQDLMNQINLGVDIEGTVVDSQDNYLAVMSEKLRFGGIVDQGRVSRLCGFASAAAKNGDLLVALKSYSIAGMIPIIKDDFKKILKKAKKEKNIQFQEAEELLNNLLPKSNKK
jgi:hypothetical protein